MTRSTSRAFTLDLRLAALATIFCLASATAQGQAPGSQAKPANALGAQGASAMPTASAPLKSPAPTAQPAAAKPSNLLVKPLSSNSTSASPTSSTAQVTASDAVAQPPVAKRRHLHRHFTGLRGNSDGLVQAANAQARAFPSPSAYVNSTLYYDFEPGRLYQVETSPHFLTAIMLKPGEKLISKASGDTVRWVMGETAEGSGASARVIILIKPIEGGLRTNMILSTDQRTYLIEVSSREGSTYSSALSWNYPHEQMQEMAALQAKAAESTVASGLNLDQLHFGYRIEPQHDRSPRWRPVRVFDDGLKTYIQFPTNMAATDAPPLFLVGEGGKAELVNYRYLNGYYVVDRLIDVAELRLGEKSQTVVRITRTKDRG